MEANSFTRAIVALALLVSSPFVCAEVAIERSGKAHRGRLLHHKGSWLFQSDQGKPIAIDELAYVRFIEGTAMPPKTPLTHTLLLPNDQRLTGCFMRLNVNAVDFVTSWGQRIALNRDEVVGIEPANDALPILREDFETSLKSWRVEGKISLTQDRPFFGKSSMLLNAPGQSVVRDWQPALRDGFIRLHFQAPPTTPDGRWTFEIITDGAQEKSPALVIGAAGYSSANMKRPFGLLKASPGWHLISLEIQGQQLRFFVDDHCLGQSTLAAKDGLKGIRVAAVGTGKLWIDELLVTRRLPMLKKPQARKDQDMLVLEYGEQFFGQITAVNPDAVVLDAKFGKRSLSWSKLRGIYFAQPKEIRAPVGPAINFRPGSGFPVDCVRAKLVGWEGTKLLVQHGQLGPISIEREWLDKIRFETK